MAHHRIVRDHRAPRLDGKSGVPPLDDAQGILQSGFFGGLFCISSALLAILCLKSSSGIAPQPRDVTRSVTLGWCAAICHLKLWDPPETLGRRRVDPPFHTLGSPSERGIVWSTERTAP
jgi:hypothetical protein